MKVIIFSASTGGGHMSASHAINEYLKGKNVESKIIDTLQYISPLLNKTVTETYDFIAKHHPQIWKMMYNTSNSKAVNKILASINNVVSRKLLPLIENFQPDIIIVTHPFAAKMISKLKSLQKIDIPLVCVMTDYAPHRTWINPGIDAYIVANDGMTEPMIKMGVNEDIIFPFGIPVDEEFFNKKNKVKILKEIGLCEKIPTVLIMSGSCGYANMEEIYRKMQKLDVNFQIIIITGKNQKLYSKMQNLITGAHADRHIRKLIPKLSTKHMNLSRLKIIKKFVHKKDENFSPSKPVKVIYFTNEVSKYMAAADLIITKPGGLTVSEALACNLPMALFDAIPGQEEENADFLVSHNMAVKLDDKNGSINIIENLLKNPEKLGNMKFSCENFDKSESLNNTYKLIQKLVNT